ncbi:MAG: hypothetical protein NZM11_00765 [Anaerolineales bacterium]|nr:hypothetical protein [Anaerolineales bacterium]
MQKQLVSSLTKVLIACVIGIAVQPFLKRDDIAPLIVSGLQVLVLSAICAGCVIIVGYAHHRLQDWRAHRPHIAWQSLPQTYAYDQDALDLAHEETVHPASADDDRQRQIVDALIRFAFVARYGGFGWRAMCRYVGYADWQRCLGTMLRQAVLTPPRGNQAADWAYGWSYSRYRMSMKYGQLDVPYPTHAEIPVILWRKSPKA